MTPTRITASIASTDQHMITRAVETFARASAGLALEGTEVIISIGPDEEPEPEPGDEQP